MSESEQTPADQENVSTASPHEDRSDASPANEPQQLVPVSEAIRYRRRAQSAEQRLDEVRHRLAQMESELDEARQTVTRLERRQRIDELLAQSDAVDLEVARLLTEAAVETMDEPDVKLAIDDLRRHKPYLFRHRPGGSASAMSAHVSDDRGSTARGAAAQAAVSGDRRDLLRYLRLRRQN